MPLSFLVLIIVMLVCYCGTTIYILRRWGLDLFVLIAVLVVGGAMFTLIERIVTFYLR